MAGQESSYLEDFLLEMGELDDDEPLADVIEMSAFFDRVNRDM